MNTMHKGITLLLRSGITGERLQLPEDFSLQEAVKLAHKQSVQPLVYQGAVNCGISAQEPAMQQLLMLYYKCLLRSEKQQLAMQKLFEAFEENAIPYLPVKGCNLKLLYPKPELRTMGDADILIHPQDHERIRPLMEKLGYQYNIENDHVFDWHSDGLHVELHKSLVPPRDEDYFRYYGTGWQLARKTTGYRYDLSDEDAYLFAVTHFAKHYRVAGIGCRHVVDLFVYRRALPDLDMGYITGELKKLRLLEFHENLQRLLDNWFEGREGDVITELITAFVFSGGSWGSAQAKMFSQEVKNVRKTGYSKHAKGRALLRAFFPPLEAMTYSYEILRRHPALLPVFWVVRWFDALRHRRSNIRNKLKTLRILDEESVLSHQKALEAVGLEFHFDTIS